MLTYINYKWSERLLFLGDINLGERNWTLINKCNAITLNGLTCCNLEGPICDFVELKSKPPAKIGSHVYNGNTTLHILKMLNVGICNLANNHIMDLGPKGLSYTMKTLSEQCIAHLGAGETENDAYTPKIVSINGNRIALLGASEAEWGIGMEQNDFPGCAWALSRKLDKAIKKERSNGARVIVQIHGGVEEELLPLPEWRSRARELIDCGATLVIMHHSHIIQGYERYLDGLIFYSLGNFLFPAQTMTVDWRRSIAVEVNFNSNAQLNVLVHGISFQAKNDTLLIEDCSESLEDLQQRSLLLKIDFYRDAINDSCERLYLNRYYNYGRTAGGEISVDSLMMTIHNMRFESHRWCAIRGIKRVLQKNGIETF